MTHSRRNFLLGTAALAAYPARADSKVTEADYADKAEADRWMQKWTQSLSAVSEPLVLGRFADRYYFLHREIGWKPNPGQEALKPVQAPVGFVTDFASIPRVFWSILPTDGPYGYAAILHDYLYWEQKTSRADADLVLKYAMEDFKVGTATVATIYAGVRAGGHFAWEGNAKLKKTEWRVMKKWPTDPTVRWETWKQNKDNF